MKFEVVQSETVYHGRAFDVRRDQVRLPDGQNIQLDIVAHVGAVTLVPVDDQGRIWFVRQYRHAAQASLLELPAGALEKGESPEAAALREVREETGLAAGRIQKIGAFFLAPGYSTEFMHVYLATELYPDPLPRDADEFLRVEAIPVDQAFRLIETGELQDAKSLIGLFLARPFIES
jgi:ADP-ribose pyrophosphatase